MVSSEDSTDIDLDTKERAMDEAPVGITISDPNREDNPLVYTNDAFEKITGYRREETLGKNCRFLQGEASDPEAISTMRDAIGQAKPVSVEIVNYRQNGEPFWNEVTIAPLMDGDGQVTHFVGFQDDVTTRKEAELALDRERRNLDQLLGRIRGLLSDVTRELVESESHEVLEQGIVDRIVERERYVFAWIGEPDRGSIVPQTWAGDLSVDAADLGVDIDETNHPTARAAGTGEVEVNEYSDGDGELWGEVRGFDGVAAVPISYGDTLYGVLTVLADQPDTFDEREVAVFDALGRAIATSFNALKSRRILTADNLVELEFEVRDPELFVVDISARCECHLEFEGSVYRQDGGLSTFFSTDAMPDDVLDVASETTGVLDTSIVSRGSKETLFEFHVEDDSFVVELAEQGVWIRSITVDDGTARIRLDLPAETEPRTVTDRFRERFAETELVAYRDHERPPITRAEFIQQLESRLTERQLTALRRAYLSGYYDSTRSVTGDELANSMGISRSTFHQHLRAAEHKLIGEFLDH